MQQKIQQKRSTPLLFSQSQSVASINHISIENGLRRKDRKRMICFDL